MREDEVTGEPVPVPAARAAAAHGVTESFAGIWVHPVGWQGCSRRTLGAFDGRRLNPVFDDAVGPISSRR